MKFLRPPPISSVNVLSDLKVRETMQRMQQIRLTFRIKKDHGHFLLESGLSEDQTVKDVGDDYEISATVVDSAMLEWWLRGFGEAVSNIRRRAIRL